MFMVMLLFAATAVVTWQFVRQHPGGGGSGEELRQIAEHDPVVEQHFQGFGYSHAHLVYGFGETVGVPCLPQGKQGVLDAEESCAASG
jgi:hypothetical protein